MVMQERSKRLAEDSLEGESPGKSTRSRDNSRTRRLALQTLKVPVPAKEPEVEAVNAEGEPLSLDMEPYVERASKIQVAALAETVATLIAKCEQAHKANEILQKQFEDLLKSERYASQGSSGKPKVKGPLLSEEEREAKKREKQQQQQQLQQQQKNQQRKKLLQSYNGSVNLDELFHQREEQRRQEYDAMRRLFEQQMLELEQKQEQQRNADMLELCRQQQVVSQVVPANDSWTKVLSHGMRKQSFLPPQPRPQPPKLAPANVVIGAPSSKRERKPRKKKLRPDAVKVTALNEASYKDLYLAVRGNRELDDAFERPRRTGEKELTLYLNKTADSSAVLSQVSQAVGQTASTRLLTEMATVEMKGVDMLVTVAEVAEAVEFSTGVKVPVANVHLRTRGDGLQVARMRVPRRAAKAMQDKVLRLGFTRVRMQELASLPIVAQRCYNCKERGHHARECKGPDRSDRCFNCGGKEHQARSCTAATRCMACTGPHVVGDPACRNKPTPCSR